MADKARELPYDVDIEQALLGALLIDENVYWRIADRLTADEFMDACHRHVFRAIVRIVTGGGVATPLTIASALKDEPTFAEVGGKAYLISLGRAAPAVPNVRDYARIIRELDQRRRIISVAQDLLEAAFSSAPEVTPTQIADQACELLYEGTHANDPGEGPVSIFDLAYRAVTLAEQALADPKSVCLSSGLVTVDQGLGLIFRDDLLVIGAATSMGKTSLVQKLLRTTADAGHGAIMFSLEMSGVSVATRYIAQEADVPSNRIRSGRVTDPEFEKIARAPEAFSEIRDRLKIDSTPGLSVAQMRARAQSYKRRRPDLAMIVVDHLQYIAPIDPRATENEAARQITKDLCALAKELNVAIVLISHLTKENERRQNKRPVMSDLYGSGGIAQNADSVWFLHRPIYYLERDVPETKDGKAYDEWLQACEREKGYAEIFSTKARMDKTGSVRVRFDEEFTRFFDPPPRSATTQLSQQDALALAGRMK